MVAIYTRAAMADSNQKIAVLESKLGSFKPNLSTEVAVLTSSVESVERQVRENYAYCHTSSHDVRNVITSSDLRAQHAQHVLGERMAVAEHQIKMIISHGMDRG